MAGHGCTNFKMGKRMSWFKKYKYSLTNIYHCSVHKAGSQWISALLSDEKIFNKTGMELFSYQTSMPGGFDPRKLTERTFDKPFPENKIISVLYLSYPCYQAIPKPDKYKSIYVQRDPRDVLISYYFSVKDSHVPMGKIAEIRSILKPLSIEEGLIYLMGHLKDQGFWTSINSWLNIEDKNVLVINYEDIIGENKNENFQRLFQHLELDLSPTVEEQLISKYSFENMAGRKSGQESVSEHLRKGVAMDWKNHFTVEVTKRFEELTKETQLLK